jgi:hypothetical protein
VRDAQAAERREIGVSVLKNRKAPWDVIMAEEEGFVEEKERLP